MNSCVPVRAAVSPPPPLAYSPSPVLPIEITIYGCCRDEAALFGEIAPRLGVLPTITETAAVEATRPGVAPVAVFAGHPVPGGGHHMGNW